MRESMVSQPLYTIGYEGLRLDSFARALEHAGVVRLIDIRCVPVSRKPGFSKQTLAQEMAIRGIEYVHIGALGNPKSGREAARSGDFQRFQSIYRCHLTSCEAQTALRQAITLALDAVSCLLCFELDHQSCHRTFVAKAMAQREDFLLTHLRGPSDEKTNDSRSAVIASRA